ncbi:NAD-dependent epimerase/dehydratase family protein [Actinoalloteichus sp. GBA129-24]|uniref:NAD-dependent epimerase/dehydratase family protein n=1 Tax=Actinoalloteichus sp. GBA129-24 TaxID=1612551 RepID=UPI0009504DC6|nr:NAD-dependent epimerase/dehydratase [Actinoalloteichus sp. GBA129-24]APU21373.1 nucleoside-diphosphate-sugar epimerase [Actinoalloteichus sp. GBA129-24]
MTLSAPPSRRGSAVVLGGTGSLGRHICAALLRAGAAQVTAVARHEGPVVPGARLLRADLLGDDDRALNDLVADSDLVVNAAGAGWRGTEEQMFRAHTVLVDRLLRLVPPPTRLVHLGSVHEYGEISPGDAADEHHPERPSAPYGQTKLIGSRSVLAAAAEGRTDAVVLRITNVCGPRAPAASFLGSLIEQLRQLPPGGRLDLTVTPDMRDFVDIRDVADAVVRAAVAPVAGLVINIGRGEVHTVPDVAEMMTGAAGLPPRRVRMRVATMPGNPGGKGAWTKVDVRRANALLGWSHTTCLQDSLRDQWKAAVSPDG